MIDLNIVFTSFRHLQYKYLLWLIPIFLLKVSISAYRWRLLSKAQNINISFRQSLSFTLVGRFFSLFLPGNVGGDLVRIYDLSRFSKKGINALTSVAADRLFGILASIILAILALCVGGRMSEQPRLTLIVFGMASLFLFGNWVFFSERLANLIVGFLDKIRLTWVVNKLTILFKAFAQFKDHKDVLLKSLILSIIIRFSTVLTVFVLSLSLGWDLSFWYFLIYVSLISIVIVVPISINAIGIREGAFIYFFAQAGIPAPDSFTLSLLLFSWLIVNSLLGGFVFLFRKTFTKISATPSGYYTLR